MFAANERTKGDFSSIKVWGDIKIQARLLESMSYVIHQGAESVLNNSSSSLIYPYLTLS